MKNSKVQTYPALIDETLVPIQKAGQSFPYPVGRKAVERYFRHGIRGIFLETVLIGNRRFSSLEAIRRFLYATNKNSDAENVTRPMTEQELQSAKKLTGIR